MIGATLGSYKIVSEIGSGGMGVVYLAEHTLLGRKVAVKLLRADMPAEYVERFFNEAKAAATLHHPGLVDVFDFGHHSDGSAYIVMEFLQGESLDIRLEREPRLPLSLALSITRSVANALHVAHEQGIIHRDLKPGNIFLVPDAEAPAGIRTKVLDFGIAKLMRDRDARSVKTQSGAVIGTPRYMSPEQCKNAKTVDGRSDIYGLGCILYEMLLGVAPFDYDTWAELVGAHLYEEPAKPSEIDSKIPADVETLICKTLEKAAEDRFATMQELAQSVEVLMLEHGARPRLSRPSVPPPRKAISGGAAEADTTVQVGAAAASLALSGAFADTEIKAARSATQALPPAVTARSSSGSKSPTPAEVAKAPTETPAESSNEAAVQTEPVPKPSKVPWLTVLIGAAGLVLLSVAGALYMTKRKKADSEPAVIIVDQRGSDGSDGSAVAKPIENPVIVDAGAQVVEAPPVDAGAGSSKPKPPPTDTDVAALTRTFGKQNAAITACFKQHGETTEKISIRIQIDKAGAVVAAAVLPETVGATPLGTCIATIAKKTAFGPQPKSATFRIPLYTSGH